MKRNRNNLERPGWSRRRWLQTSGAALGLLALPWPLDGACKGRAKRAVFRYRTDPERIARVLPPPLTPGEDAEVFAEYVHVCTDAISPGAREASWFVLAAKVRYQGLPGLYPLLGVSSTDLHRVQAREGFGLNLKDGRVEFVREGGRIRAECGRRGKTVHAFEAELGKQPEERPAAVFSSDFHAYVYRYRPAADWTAGVAGEGPVELWRVDAEAEDVLGEGETALWRLESARLESERMEASVLDPVIEFPVDEPLSAWYEERSWSEAGPLPPRGAARLSEVPANKFEPFALARYDRPVEDRRPWTPKGWRAASSALVLSTGELQRYRERREQALGPLHMLDIEFMTGVETHEAILPPECRPGMRPMLRLVALQAQASSLSPAPFSEAWLLAYCWAGSRAGWFALSHIASQDGDVLFGREALGFPSKTGEVELTLGPEDFSLSVRRLGRQVAEAEGRIRGFSPGVSLGELHMVGLRPRGFRVDSASEADLISQPWYFQGNRQLVDPASVSVRFLEPPDRESTTDPWYELQDLRLVTAAAFDHVRMQREPGVVAGEAANFAPYYLERCDGWLPGQPFPEQGLRTTFRARDARLRS